MAYFVKQEIKISCEDNYVLAVTAYLPDEVKAAVVIGPATGMKRQFYNAFAEYLASNDFGVLTYDNRGIGQSIDGDIATHTASLQCCGQLDKTAAISSLQQLFPNTSYHLVGHSAGGQLIGLAKKATKLSSIFNVASSSGQLRNMKLKDQFKSHFFMYMFIPFSNTVFGYTKSQWFGMGEPLAKQVAKQWQTWCNGSGYVKTAFNKTVFTHYYNELTMTALWVNAVDDFIATDENVRDMMSVSHNLSAKTLTLSPGDHNLKEIGHMAFFSRRANTLWPIALDWLNSHS